MNKRFSTILTITVAAVLVSSIAYAAKKKLQTKSEPLIPDMSEVDLAADLLNSNGEHKHKSLKDRDRNNHGDEELKDLIMVQLHKE